MRILTTLKILKGVRSPKARSKTFPGIAAAFADQWGEVTTNVH